MNGIIPLIPVLLTFSINVVKAASPVEGQLYISESIPVGGAAAPLPAQAAQGVLLPFFSWPVNDQASAYHLYLGPNSTSMDWIAEIPGSESGYYYAPGLAPASTYYWRVDVVLNETERLTGPVWYFTTQGLQADTPWPLPGERNVSDHPVLQWRPGLTSYRQDLYIGSDAQVIESADTAWPVYQGRLPGRQSLFEVGTLDPNTTYYWRLDTVELNGTLHSGLVWSFTTWPAFPVVDPNLVAWWQFDEGQGQTVLDESGHKQHCHIGQGVRIPGRDGAALSFEDSTMPAEGPGTSLPVGHSPFTLSTWLNVFQWAPEQNLLRWGTLLPGMTNQLFLRNSSLHHSFGEDHYSIDLGQSLAEWVHVALIHRGDGQRRFFLNGTPQTGRLLGGVAKPRVTQGRVYIGGRAWPHSDAGFQGALDDLRIYNRALSEVDMQSLIQDDPLKASQPHPRDRSVVDVTQALPLSWAVGLGFRHHELYFGEDRDRVLSAEPNSIGIYQGQVHSIQFSPSEPLGLDRTYYWRVDERQPDGSVVKGDLWRFKVADYFVVDNFESYEDEGPLKIFRVWRDGVGYEEGDTQIPGNGTGSQVGHWDPPYAEQEIVYGGSQSLPLYYNNAERATTSQTDRSFDAPQDWTRTGVRRLRLYFSGRSDNRVHPSDTLYLRITDEGGQGKLVHYDGSATALQEAHWHMWSFSLSLLSDQGLDMQRITQLSIGVGNPSAPEQGGTGIVYIDDIHLTSD